jgi:hypothetical protein
MAMVSRTSNGCPPFAPITPIGMVSATMTMPSRNSLVSGWSPREQIAAAQALDQKGERHDHAMM